MPRVKAGEVHLGWRSWGEGDTVVVFIHGNLASKDWIELAAGSSGGWSPLRLHGAAEWGGWWRTDGSHILPLVAASAGEPQLLS